LILTSHWCFQNLKLTVEGITWFFGGIILDWANFLSILINTFQEAIILLHAGFYNGGPYTQNQLPEADCKKHRLRQAPRYYWKLIVKDFPIMACG